MSNLWTTLVTFDNPIEAHILKGLLESEGIEVFLLGEHFFSIQTYINLEIAHIRFQVLTNQLSSAREIFLDYQKGAYEQFLMQEFNLNPLQCSGCGSNETKYKLSYASFATSAVLALYFIGVFLKPKKYLICKQCKAVLI